MILVKIYWNTDEHGEEVDHSVPLEDMPMSYYGPFDDISQAISWMENDYPDGDTDVHDMVADDFKISKQVVPHINSPSSIHGDIPDEDIRPDSQEIHAP